MNQIRKNRSWCIEAPQAEATRVVPISVDPVHGPVKMDYRWSGTTEVRAGAPEGYSPHASPRAAPINGYFGAVDHDG
jgi:hypothetical protein